MVPNRKKLKSVLLKALGAAGKHLKANLGERRVRKKAALSLVTRTDKAAEKAVVQTIRAAFPEHSILTEESPPSGVSPCRWIIDPLDGTTNFAHTYPVACVSVAYEEAGNLVMGGVFDPYRKELFFAERGKGAWLNNRKIRVSQTKKLSEALIATGFPYDQMERHELYLALFKPFLLATQGLRRAGAAAIDLCYVACGRFDGYWEYNLHPWDKAAGMLMITEAGGKTTDFSGAPLTLKSTQNLISNGALHAQMLDVVKPFKDIP
jgi:myo-inositol-1(or 4)-monophosphatase